MKDKQKPKEQLINELAEMRQPTTETKTSQTQRQRAGEASRKSEGRTVLRQSKRNQQQGEKRFRELIDSLPEIVLEADTQGKLTFVNRAASDTFGYTQEDFDRGLNVLEVIVPENRDMAKDNIRRVIAGQELAVNEYIVQRKDGSRFPIIIHSIRITDAEGNPVGFRAVIVNVSERKRAEEALRESERRYRLLAENVSDVICTLDMNLHFTYVSPSFTRVLGYSVEEAMSQTVAEVLTPASFEAVTQALAEELAIENTGGRHLFRSRTLEFEATCKDGSTVWAEGSFTFLRDPDGRPVGFIGVARDITERKRRESELALIARLTGIITSSADINEVYEGFVSELKQVIDVDWATINLIEGQELRVFALSTEIGATWALGAVLPVKGTATEWVAQNKQASVERDLSQRRRFWTGEYHLRQGLRSVIHVPLFSQGQVFGCLVIGSQRPNAYSEREVELLEFLTSQIAGVIENARLYQLERKARAELERQERERAEFIAAITHELKTPLTSIIASGGLLAEELETEPQSPGARLIQNITRSAQSMEARLSELLDLAKMRTGGFKLRLAPVDIEAVLREVAAQFLPVAESKGQTLSLELSPSLPQLKADRQRVEQILLNLLTNAAKFTPRGGRITLRAERDGANIVIEVQDEGSGISKEEQERLFQPYYRVEADRQRFAGLGLGLALAKQLVELHSGEIWVESELGRGSTFGFSLPLSGGQR